MQYHSVNYLVAQRGNRVHAAKWEEMFGGKVVEGEERSETKEEPKVKMPCKKDASRKEGVEVVEVKKSRKKDGTATDSKEEKLSLT